MSARGKCLLALTIVSIVKPSTETLSCIQGFHYGPTSQKNRTCNGFARLNGVKIGHSRAIMLNNGRRYMTTKSLKPLVFQIPDFLSSDECQRIIQLAKLQGLKESKTISNEFAPEKLDPRIVQLLKARYRRVGKRFGNHFTNIKDFQSYLQQTCAFYPYEHDARTIFREFDVNLDGALSEQELISSNEETMGRLVDMLEELKNSPRYRARYSSQAWLSMNSTADEPVLRSLRERIVRATRLPEWVIETSEPLQVVRYSVNGHFHGHYDSTEDYIGKELPCCQGYNMTGCHLCRYMTILFFLNDVTRGGETAFLVAGAATIPRVLSTNLSTHCNASRLVISPKKGTAVLWYNHFLDPRTGLLGNLDRYSLHGGCDVIEGTKWIANSWINLPKGN